MKNRLLLILLLLTVSLLATTCHYRRQAERFGRDRHSLLHRLEQQHARNDSLATHCEVLTLEREEFRQLYRAENEQLKKLRIRLRRVESMATSATQTAFRAEVPLADSLRITRRDTAPLIDTLRRFVWRDRWNLVEGFIDNDSIHCRVRTIDTLHQVVHRIPHRFLFFRWGTKALRQEIRSSNPSTQIVYTEYLIIAR